MKKLYPLLALAALLWAPQLRAQKSIYDFGFENQFKLPPMKFYILKDVVSESYQTQSESLHTEITAEGEPPITQSSSAYISNPLAIDAVRMLEHYAMDHLLEKGKAEGSAELSVIYFNRYDHQNLGTVVGYLTFGISAILGVPISTVVIDVELQAEFFDKDGHSTATYRATAQAKKRETLFNSPSDRLIHQKAIREALVHLNQEIMADSSLWKAN
ncbi:MAG: hypothetical protein CSA96_02975 [Bacteroidetes bacterium]|nr:MAG: hypothetical protein CSA96_02975 [Bacteroidota bacterium]